MPVKRKRTAKRPRTTPPAVPAPPDRRRFRQRLLTWYGRHGRDLPWRRTDDPYHILVSEIMLQQTRAQTVSPYYRRFLTRFPTVRSLANADETSVLACWSGLGYYSRARNLQSAAREILRLGKFPSDYDALRALPGVGGDLLGGRR